MLDPRTRTPTLGTTTLVLTIAAGLVAVEPAWANAAPAAEDGDPNVAIQTLWREASAAWDTSNYAVAIEKFEAGLQLAKQHGHWAAPHLQVALAEAHLREWFIDEDARHLRRARELFESHLDAGDEGEPDLDARAEAGLTGVERQLATLDQSEPGVEPEPKPDPKPDLDPDALTEPEPDVEPGVGPAPDRRDPARPPGLAIAGVAVGGGLLATGVGLLIYGSQVPAIARRQAADQGQDGGLAENQAAYVDEFQRNISIAGGVTAVVGAALTTAGVVGLVRHRQRRDLGVAPQFGPAGAGVVVFGRF